MANKGRNLNRDEKSLWARMTQGIKAWHQDIVHEDSDDPKMPKTDKSKHNNYIQMNAATHEIPMKSGPNGLDKRTQNKLSKGRMPIEGRIDLHGMTQEQARQALNSFVYGAYNGHKRCLLVITGKGSSIAADDGIVSERRTRGVLRARLTEWIYTPPLSDMVLSHAHATPRDGGSGAFYIYLRNRNKY